MNVRALIIEGVCMARMCYAFEDGIHVTTDEPFCTRGFPPGAGEA